MADKILIVDDEKEIADLVALYLENENFTVYKYYTAKDALKCIQEETLDLAIRSEERRVGKECKA